MQASRTSTAQVNPSRSADFGESLTCTICAEILEGAVSVQPCLHTFCGACASHWIMEQGHENCPECRRPVTALATNHRVMDLVGKYLLEHPDEERTPAEKQKMRRANQVEQNGGIVQLNAARMRGAGATTATTQQSSDSSDSGLGWLVGAAAVGAVVGGGLIALLAGSKKEKKEKK
eukprot:scpid94630/ scgid17382/ E3 ubiquitin-protein ligase CHFR; Checkpoint with forkhead and RING finger domains protein